MADLESKHAAVAFLTSNQPAEWKQGNLAFSDEISIIDFSRDPEIKRPKKGKMAETEKTSLRLLPKAEKEIADTISAFDTAIERERAGTCRAKARTTKMQATIAKAKRLLGEPA